MDTRSDQAAHRLAEMAGSVREIGARLSRLDAVVWSSLSADRFRADLVAVAAGIARTADAVDEAGAALRRHAASVGRMDWPGLDG